MRDYFSEFLLRNPIGTFASWLGDDATPTASVTTSNLKTHLIWSLVTAGLVFVTWKTSAWYAGYQFLKQHHQKTLA